MQTSKWSIRKNDTVQVIAGREKGKSGKVLRVSQKTGRVTVGGLNMVKRHVKPSQKHPQGGLIEKETGLHFSNVLLFCTKCNRGVRHGIKVEKGGDRSKKARICKRCDAEISGA